MVSYSAWLAGINSCNVGRSILAHPDIYGLLLPPIREEDEKTGTSAYLDQWDNPDGEIYQWDQEQPFQAAWDRIGLRPVLKRLFAVLEDQHGQHLEELEDMKHLVDPDTCPVAFLKYMATSLGYSLDDSLSEEAQRATIRGIQTAYKEHGTPLSWQVFFRMIGYKVKAYPLWKKEYAEDADRYDRDRYVTTTPFVAVPLAGVFVNSMTQAPLRPYKLTITDGTEVMRDDGKGNLVGSAGGYGTVNYLTGALRLHFAPPGPVGPITASGETVNEEYPYHAARVDFDFFLVPLSGAAPPAVTTDFVNKVLRYLEEVRPIHVILRTFNLIMPVEEDLTDIVTDEACCGPSVAVDHWTSHEDYYLGDVGPHPQDTHLTIDQGTTAKHVIVDDLTPFINPLRGDPLVIASLPVQPFDGAY